MLRCVASFAGVIEAGGKDAVYTQHRERLEQRKAINHDGL